MDPERAARDLAEADRRRRRGAELTDLPRWLRLTCSVFLVSFGARYDVPAAAQRWYAVLMLVVLVVYALGLVLVRTRIRARPLHFPVGWRALLLFGGVVIAAGAVMFGSGFGLRALGVPLPFTLSSLLTVLAIWLLNWRLQRWGGSYVQRVVRGRW